jgi:hypothetical protein
MERFLAFLYLEAEGLEHVPADADLEASADERGRNDARDRATSSKSDRRDLDLRTWLLGARI